MINMLFDARTFEHSFSGIAITTLALYQALHEYYGDSINICGMYRDKLYEELPKFIKTTKAFFPIKKYSSLNIRKAMHTTNSRYLHFPLNGEMPFGLIPGKKISTIHDVLPLEIPGYFKRVEEEKNYRKKMQSNIHRTDIIFTPSQYSKRRIYEEFKVDVPIIVQPWACNEIKTEVQKTKIKNIPYFLYAGGYEERKGIYDLLKSLLVLKKNTNEDFYVVFVGKKRVLNETTESLFTECKKIDLIDELGYVSNQELAQLYKNAIALCFLSKYEGFGLTPLEAMSYGCPVITTNYTSLPEVCGDAALFVDPQNSEEVAQKMEQLLVDEKLRARLVEKGYKQANRFSWKKSADIFMKHISEI